MLALHSGSYMHAHHTLARYQLASVPPNSSVVPGCRQPLWAEPTKKHTPTVQLPVTFFLHAELKTSLMKVEQ